MQLSKLTFSLASLVLLMAFVAMPAMAHLAPITNAYVPDDHDGVPNEVGDDTTSETNHQHTDAPTVGLLELVDLKVGTDEESSVSGTNVVLVDNAGTPTEFTDVVGTATARPATAGQFQVKITFSDPVYADRTNSTGSTGDLATLDLAVTAASQAAPGVNLGNNGVTFTIARVAADDADTKDVDESTQTFLVTFVVNASLFGDLSVDPVEASDLPIDVYVTVKQNVLFTADDTLVGGDLRDGRGNTASSKAKFTVVPKLPDALDTGAPTVMSIKASAPDMTSGNVIFTITFSEACYRFDTRRS